MSIRRVTYPDPPEPVAYTVEETAKLLKVGRNYVYTLVRSGELSHTRIGQRIRITPDQIDRYLHDREEGTKVG